MSHVEDKLTLENSVIPENYISKEKKSWINKYKVIHVTEEDIKKGEAGSIESCPIARALERTFYDEGCYEARVHGDDGSIHFEDRSELTGKHSEEFPDVDVTIYDDERALNLYWDDKIETWISQFDGEINVGEECKPFDIELRWSNIFAHSINCKMIND